MPFCDSILYFFCVESMFMNRFQIQNEMVMPSCYVSWNLLWNYAYSWYICQENFEFKWVNTRVFENRLSLGRKNSRNERFLQHIDYKELTLPRLSFTAKAIPICVNSPCDLRQITMQFAANHAIICVKSHARSYRFERVQAISDCHSDHKRRPRGQDEPLRQTGATLSDGLSFA